MSTKHKDTMNFAVAAALSAKLMYQMTTHDVENIFYADFNPATTQNGALLGTVRSYIDNESGKLIFEAWISHQIAFSHLNTIAFRI